MQRRVVRFTALKGTPNSIDCHALGRPTCTCGAWVGNFGFFLAKWLSATRAPTKPVRAYTPKPTHSHRAHDTVRARAKPQVCMPQIHTGSGVRLLEGCKVARWAEVRRGGEGLVGGNGG